MYKRIEFPGEDDQGNIFVQAITPSYQLEKLASAELHPNVGAFVANLCSSKDKIYVLVNALSAGEYYSSNMNADYFEESELFPKSQEKVDNPKYGYRTFLSAGVYRNHRNKDTEKSIGKVVLVVYNEKMHRVELVIEIDRKKAENEGHRDLLDKLDAGEHPAVSMGARVKFDVCSICGHKSYSIKNEDRCFHMREMRNKILSDGRKVFVFNPEPRFFDISFVIIGADRVSYTMLKLASLVEDDITDERRFILSSLKEKIGRKRKLSTITKNLPAISARVLSRLENSEPDLPRSFLNMAANSPLEQSLKTISTAGIALRPREYQRIVLVNIGRPALADRLDDSGHIFPVTGSYDKSVNFSLAEIIPELLRRVLPFIEGRCAYSPVISRRIVLTINGPEDHTKLASASASIVAAGEEVLLKKISAGYNGYREQLFENLEKLASLAMSNTDLLPAIYRADFEDSLCGGLFSKEASLPPGLLGILPLAYLYGAGVREDAQSGRVVSAVDRLVERNPAIAASIITGLLKIGIGLKGSPQAGVLLGGLGL